MELDAGKLSFEDEARVLLANARREHPMPSTQIRRWIEESLPAGLDQRLHSQRVKTPL
ncbi:MAG: hypothetical protein ACTHKD_07010 [Devosia sp.]